jgi:ankyrin repeat protein
MWAASQSHPAVVELLLKAGADYKARSLTYPQSVKYADSDGGSGVQTISRGGSTALLFAARSGDAESARLLLAAGADVNDALPDGTSALVVAAHSAHSDAAIALLEGGADHNSITTGYTALHAAVLRGELKLVQALLARKANPNLRMTKGTPMRRSSADYNLPGSLIGSTPSYLAAKFLEPQMMRALVRAGADPKLGLPDGTTPLMAAVGMGSRKNANRRGISGLEYLGKPEPESRIVETTSQALRLGGEVNAANQAGDTALHSAAAQGLDAVVELLVKGRAQLNPRNKRGQTPLSAAMPKGTKRASIVTASAAAGVNFSASVEAPEPGHPSTVELLRKLGATE